MTCSQYEHWINEIKQQKDMIIATQQYVRLLNVFVQDVWLDTREIELDHHNLHNKATQMFELQAHFVK